MALKGETLATIKEVHSHPMALLQCKVFFKDHPHIKLVEAKDTAEVAKQISENNIKSVRPGLGLGSQYYFNVIGKKVKINVKKNTPVRKKQI